LNGVATVTGCFIYHEQSDPIAVHPLPYSGLSAYGATGGSEQRRCFGCHGGVTNVSDGGILSDLDIRLDLRV
jgi:hypothetical protein